MNKLYLVLICLFFFEFAFAQERIIYQNFEKVHLDSLPSDLTEKVGVFLNVVDFNMKLKKVPGLSIFENSIQEKISSFKDSIITERGMVSTSYFYEDSKLINKKTETDPGRSFSASYVYDDEGKLIGESTGSDEVNYEYENGTLKSYLAKRSQTEVKFEYLNDLTEIRNTWLRGKDASRDTIYYNEAGKIVEARSFRYDFYHTIDNFKNSFNEQGNLVKQIFEQKSNLEEKILSHYVGKESRDYNQFQWIESQSRGATNKANFTKLIFFERSFSYEAFKNEAGQFVLVKKTKDKKNNKQSKDIYVLDDQYNWIVHEIQEDGKFMKTTYRNIKYITE